MAQLVARYLGVVEAVGSSPVTQTILKPRSFGELSRLRGFLFFEKSILDEKLTKNACALPRKTQKTDTQNTKKAP